MSQDNNNSGFSDPNFAKNKTLPIHRWIPWIAGFSKDFVDSAIKTRMGKRRGLILDPFCGVGTTLLSAIYHGHNAVGFEINPYAALASKVKSRAHLFDFEQIKMEIARFKTYYALHIESEETSGVAPLKFKTKIEFYSPRVLRKVLVVKSFIESIDNADVQELFKAAFGATLVKYSNYSYEPSLGTREAAGKKRIDDYDVVSAIEEKLDEILTDISYSKKVAKKKRFGDAKIIADSFFNYSKYIKAGSVDLIITSPPYLNNYHYIRNTRPQLYWLDLILGSEDLKKLEKSNFGKYWQTVRQEKPISLDFRTNDGEIESCIASIRNTNHDGASYGGAGWANYVTTYLNDCNRFSQGIKYCLKKGGCALVVIGNNIIQGVPVPTDVFFGKIAELNGLRVTKIHILREKRIGDSITQSTVRIGENKIKTNLYEAVVELELL
ncbi:MAG: DNA methyltransferase [Candidatus Micrarchaeia archaeon]|jgi:DNA modification methylase